MDGVYKKGVRRVNFSNEEIGTITEFVKNNKDILFGERFPPSQKEIVQLYEELAETASAIGVSPRTVLEIKTKFKIVKMNAKQHFQIVKKAQAATGGVEKLKAGEEELHEVIEDSTTFTGLNGCMTSDNTNETYNSTISESSSSEVGGPSYDIREMVDTDVAEFENVREKNCHTVDGKQKSSYSRWEAKIVIQ